MYEQFEVRWEGVLAADPQQAWDAITAQAAAWVWEIEYEPREGGSERGLTSSGGTVTAWDPPRRFETRAQRPDGWRNALRYELAPHAQGTLLSYRHTGVFEAATYAATLDQCRQHTDLYLHTLGVYLRHFGGRTATYVGIEPHATFAELRGRLGLGDEGAGQRVRLAPDGLRAFDAVVDYRTRAFLGLRTDDALVRVFGRDAWEGPVGVSLHLFGSRDEVQATGERWRRWLATAPAGAAAEPARTKAAAAGAEAA